MKITTKQLKQLIQEELAKITEVNPLAGSTRTEPVEQPADPNNPLAGSTRTEPQADDGGNKKLALVAKELQLLLKKIQAELS